MTLYAAMSIGVLRDAGRPRDRSKIPESTMRPGDFVPESRTVDRLLCPFLERGQHFVVVAAPGGQIVLGTRGRVCEERPSVDIVAGPDPADRRAPAPMSGRAGGT